MADNVMAALADPVSVFSVAFQGQCTGTYGRFDTAVIKNPCQPPGTHPAAELHRGFCAKIAYRGGNFVAVLAPSVVAAVSVEQRIFRPLLIVDHEIDGDRNTTGPFRIRSVSSITDEIPRQCQEGCGIELVGILRHTASFRASYERLAS
ncbi:hypothetical protein DTW90_36850 [Neorhizobium sp. P12A]|nr:hypothetical protein DTW90_36850 [Neorhizobium sp. P12A]